MNNKLVKALAFLVLLVIVGIFGWAIVRGVEADPGVVGSFATALGAILAVVLGRQREKSLDLQQAHRDALIPIYQEFISRSRKQVSDLEAAADFMGELGENLLLRGPSPVVGAYVAWLRSFFKDGNPLPEGDPSILLAWEKVIRAIRADLGHDDSSLKPGELLRVIVWDIDDYLPSSTGTLG